MNVEELKRKLSDLGVRENYCYFGGGYCEGRVCLEYHPGSWAVYSAERGHREVERNFTTEAEACDYILQLAMNDRTSRQ